jgi:hypothetical protein
VWTLTLMDAGSSVTLIFYCVDQNNVANEPFLNIVAAIAQGSSLTHVEMAIVSAPESSNTHTDTHRAGPTASRSGCAPVAQGESPGSGGQMTNVLRIFNDSTGAVSAFVLLDPLWLLLPHSVVGWCRSSLSELERILPTSTCS